MAPIIVKLSYLFIVFCLKQPKLDKTKSQLEMSIENIEASNSLKMKTIKKDDDDDQSRHYFKGRRKYYLFFASYTLLAIVLLELVLINPNLRPVEAGKKKKIIKKIKEILPLVALLKRKKIILLPIPM